MVRTVATVYGRVQGVGFRDTVVAHAWNFAVAGTVRNLSESGAVEIDVEGEPHEVEMFLAAVLARPPAWARVDDVVRREEPPLGRRQFARGRTV